MAVADGVTDCEPDALIEPLQPPDAVHPVALVDDQVSVDWLPEVIEVLSAERLTVGAELEVCPAIWTATLR